VAHVRSLSCGLAGSVSTPAAHHFLGYISIRAALVYPASSW
jgi:hypothetical protein